MDLEAHFDGIKMDRVNSNNAEVDGVIIQPGKSITDEELAYYIDKTQSRVDKIVDRVGLGPVVNETWSEDGKYKLQIHDIRTKPGFFSFTVGRVYSDDKLMFEIRRNYSHFAHVWLVKDGHQYLITGEDYQGLTILNLTEGWKRNLVPKSAVQGLGFCFSGANMSDDGNYLAVYGCIWGFPYQIEIYYFKDPKNMTLVPLVIANDDYLLSCESTWTEKAYHQWLDLRPEVVYSEDAFSVYSRERKGNPQDVIRQSWDALGHDERESYEDRARISRQERFQNMVYNISETILDDPYITDFKYHPDTRRLELIYAL